MSERAASRKISRCKSQSDMTPEEIEIRRAKHREYQRRYRAAHPDRVRARANRWRKTNPEKVKEEKKRYNARHPEKAEEWRRTYDERWPERVRAAAERSERKRVAKRRDLAAIKRRKRCASQAFCEKPSLSENELFRRIQAAVPRWLPQFVRDDVISEIVLAVLEGTVLVDQIQQHAKKCLHAHNRMFDQFGTVSLDEEIPGTDGLTYGDRLIYEDDDQEKAEDSDEG